MLFQENDHLGFGADIVPLRPDLIAFALTGPELRFDIHQPLDLAFSVIASRHCRNMNVIAFFGMCT